MADEGSISQNAQSTHGRGAYKEAKKSAFLKAFRCCGTVVDAAKSVRIARETVYLWRRNDPEFQKEFDQVNDDVVGILEDTAFSRAIEKSDALLMFLLKARRPRIYLNYLYEEPGNNAVKVFSDYLNKHCSSIPHQGDGGLSDQGSPE
jgi:hypothetical protein